MPKYRQYYTITQKQTRLITLIKKRVTDERENSELQGKKWTHSTCVFKFYNLK